MSCCTQKELSLISQWKRELVNEHFMILLWCDMNGNFRLNNVLLEIPKPWTLIAKVSLRSESYCVLHLFSTFLKTWVFRLYIHNAKTKKNFVPSLIRVNWFLEIYRWFNMIRSEEIDEWVETLWYKTVTPSPIPGYAIIFLHFVVEYLRASKFTFSFL